MSANHRPFARSRRAHRLLVRWPALVIGVLVLLLAQVNRDRGELRRLFLVAFLIDDQLGRAAAIIATVAKAEPQTADGKLVRTRVAQWDGTTPVDSLGAAAGEAVADESGRTHGGEAPGGLKGHPTGSVLLPATVKGIIGRDPQPQSARFFGGG